MLVSNQIDNQTDHWLIGKKNSNNLIDILFVNQIDSQLISIQISNWLTNKEISNCSATNQYSIW